MSISPACYFQLVKLLINLEPHGIFGSNFAYLCILILSSHCSDMQNGAEHQFQIVRSRNFSENAYNC